MNPEQRLDDWIGRARTVLPQNWPFGAVWAIHHEHGPYPHFVERADGARFWDVTGRDYIDWFVGGGVATLGHRHPAVQRAMLAQLERGVHLSLPSPLEVEVAESLCALFPGAEQVAYGKNGTDVTSAAVRLARAVTGREHVLISGYHGWQDWAKAIRAEVPGIPAALRGLVHEFGFDDLAGAERLLHEFHGQVAAIVVEPVRTGVPSPEFLPGLRQLADRHGCLLVFDEIVTGLRVARGGAQALAGVRPDLTCLAKSLANGLPLAALLGQRRWMRHLPPTFFALTYQREALSLAAARASLEVFRKVDVTAHLARIGEAVRAAFAAAAARHDLPWELRGHPAMLHMHFTAVGRLTARGASTLFVECCQRQGIYVQLYRVLPCLAHSDADVERTASVFADAMATVRAASTAGLAAFLDSPVWNDFENAPPPPQVKWEGSGIASGAWLEAPAEFAAPGCTWVRPAGDVGQLAAQPGQGIRFRVPPLGRQRSSDLAIDLLPSFAGDFRVAARFSIPSWHVGDGVLGVGLALLGEGAPGWHEITHQTSFGQTPQVRASLAENVATVPLAYGKHAATLVLERRRGVLRAACDVDWREVVSAVPAAGSPCRVRFFVRVKGPTTGEVAVALEQMKVEVEPDRA